MDEVGSDSGDGSERRQRVRLNLSTEQFRLKENGKIFGVFDISRTGMAIQVVEPQDFAHFPVGRQIEGILNIQRTKYPVIAMVRHLGGSIVGCEFGQLPPKTEKAIHEFLDPKVIGPELREAPVKNRDAIWFHAASGTELVFYRREAEQAFRRFTVQIFGSYVRWDDHDGLSTGQVQAVDDRRSVPGIIRLETMILSPDGQVDSGKLDIAKQLILSSNIPQEFKDWAQAKLAR
ncbi:MAG: PilZ domain-containing protein [Bacteriovoracia bacterium]